MPSVWNSTQATVVTNSIDNSGLLTIAIILVAIVGLALLITSVERYTAFFNAIEKIIKTIKYALYGAGISASVYAIYLLCGVATTASRGFDPIIIAYLIVGYIILAAIGYAGELVVKRIKTIHNKYKENKMLEVTS